MNLYPILTRSVETDQLARELASLTIDECRRRRATSHRRAVYLATGGSARATVRHLEEIRDGLAGIAEAQGYPSEQGRKTGADAEWAEFLHRNVPVTPYQAAHDGMWQFMTLALVPDLVRWRWGAAHGEAQALDRWLTVRYRQRNTFGRLWWRCAMLHTPGAPGAYRLIHELGEDELVQIMERPTLCGNRRLSRMTAETLLEVASANPTINRANLLREQQKRILRLGAFIEFQMLGDEDLLQLIRETFRQSADALRDRE